MKIISGLSTLLLLLWCLLHTARPQAAGQQSSMPLPANTCGNPNYGALQEQLLQHYDIFDLFYKLPRFAESSGFPRHLKPHDTSYLADNGYYCQLLQNQEIGTDQDPCPGEWQDVADPDRVPCVLREFRCACVDCLIPSELKAENHDTQCEPVYNYVPVMRKHTDASTGVQQWRYTLDRVVVACYCRTLPRIGAAR